jgi:hypothetical protein
VDTIKEPAATSAGARSTSFTTITAARAIANFCNTGACPTIYESGPESVVVQGFKVSPDRVEVDLPDGETLVEIPRELLVEALRTLS